MYLKDFCAIISPPQNYVFSNVCFQQSWEVETKFIFQGPHFPLNHDHGKEE